MTIKERLKTFFGVDEEETELYENNNVSTKNRQEPVNKPASIRPVVSFSPNNSQRKNKNNVIDFNGNSRANEVILVEPVSYADSQIVADHLGNKRSVVINLHLINEAQARRILDFLSGFIYAVNGDIQRIGSNIFILTPESVTVSGAISAFEQDGEFQESVARW